MTWACGEARWAGQQGGVQHGDAQTDGIASREESMSDRTCAQNVDERSIIAFASNLEPATKRKINEPLFFFSITVHVTRAISYLSVTLTPA